ncbi:hypothetical protein B0T13DRAFT_478496 [Neurospora crassa]|nr:hypothetical protein B0T13DRAFT_478496 [Neurospora crassa]
MVRQLRFLFACVNLASIISPIKCPRQFSTVRNGNLWHSVKSDGVGKCSAVSSVQWTGTKRTELGAYSRVRKLS